MLILATQVRVFHPSCSHVGPVSHLVFNQYEVVAYQVVELGLLLLNLRVVQILVLAMVELGGSLRFIDVLEERLGGVFSNDYVLFFPAGAACVLAVLDSRLLDVLDHIVHELFVATFELRVTIRRLLLLLVRRVQLQEGRGRREEVRLPSCTERLVQVV